jgi:hypothetical protein
MNKLIKIAFGVQSIIAILALIHNFFYVRFSMDFLQFLLYASIGVGAFLTWKVFDKTQAKGTRIAAFILGTIPMVCTLLFILLIYTALRH